MIDISLIIPIYNGEKWITSCMDSISTQSIFNTNVKVEIVIYNDGSTDETKESLQVWRHYFNKRDIPFIIIESTKCNGVGAAKNGAVKASRGEYLCFQDIDDVMHDDRILLQWEYARHNKNTLIGSKILRDPTNSTPRLVHWANSLLPELLKVQIYLSYGPTILMPTWFCHKSVYDNVGGFDEAGQGTPEDLIFFYAHIDAGGDIYRIEKELLIYRYHEGATTFTITKNMIQGIQLQRLENKVLFFWKKFTIWNAGKAGRRLVRKLNTDSLKKVVAFCDVDKKKIGRSVELYCPAKRKVIVKVPVINFKEAKPPFVICVKLDLTNGEFERNLESLKLVEGKDYIIFS